MKFLLPKKKVLLAIAFVFTAPSLLLWWMNNFTEEGVEDSYVDAISQGAAQAQPERGLYLLPPASAIAKSGETYFIKNNEIWIRTEETEEQLTFDGEGQYQKSFVTLSPNQKYLTYFQDLAQEEGMSDDDYYWQNYTALRILDITSRETKEIYRGSFKVGSYEWLSDNEVAVWVGCGTECSYLEVVDTRTKNKTQLMYGVGYTWSPNKKYVLAYHYAVQPGVTVGDKFGNELFTLRREHPQNGESVSAHKAAWSPNSSKLALIINRNNEARLELLVFAIEDNFRPLLQKDLESTEFTELGWRDTQTVFYTTTEGGFEVRISNYDTVQ